MRAKNTKSGIIRWILLIIVGILLLSYFGFDLRGLVEDDQTQSNFSFIWEFLADVWDFVVNVWETYVQEPAGYIWGFIKNMWNRWLAPLLETVQSTTPDELLENVPGVE